MKFFTLVLSICLVVTSLPAAANNVIVDNDSPNFSIEISKLKTKVNGGYWVTKGKVAGEVVPSGAIDQWIHYTCTWADCSTQRRFKVDLIKEMPNGGFKECVNVKIPYSGQEPSEFDSWLPVAVAHDLGDLFEAFKDCNLHDPNCTCTWQ